MPKEFWVTAPRTIEFRGYEELPLQSGEVRLKSIMSGISHGTELNLYRGTTPFANQRFEMDNRLFLPGESRLSFPLQLGYEMVGEVTEVAPDVTTLKTGDLAHGYLRHRETNVARAENLVPLPGGMGVEDAMFIALSVVALNSVHDAGVKLGDEVAVFGLGVIGLLVVQLAKLSGAAKVYAVDPIPKRCEKAKSFGADAVLNSRNLDVALEIKKQSERRGVDVSIECSGTYPALQEAIRSVRMAGKVVTLGYYQGGATPLNLGAEWHHNRITMLASMGVWECPHRCYPLWDYRRMKETALRLLTEKRVRTQGFITHQFPFAKVQEAYELIDHNAEEAIKVVITY